MKRFFTYFLLVALLNTLSGLDNFIYADEYSSIEMKDKESEESEENGEEISEFNVMSSEYQVAEAYMSYQIENGSDLASDSKCANLYHVATHLKLHILYEQYLI